MSNKKEAEPTKEELHLLELKGWRRKARAIIKGQGLMSARNLLNILKENRKVKCGFDISSEEAIQVMEEEIDIQELDLKIKRQFSKEA